jgi:hypothetical protein
MQSRDDDLDALLARLTATERPQELTLNRTRSADGSITEQWQIDTPEDVTLYQQLMALTAPQPSALGELIHQHVPSLPAPRRTTKPAIETITLGKARDAWLDSIKASTLPKTWTIKRTAIDLLTRFLGEKTKLHTITRSDLARWYCRLPAIQCQPKLEVCG